MPFQVQQLIEGKAAPVCVTKEDTVESALALMIQNDYSQLPVISKEGALNVPHGMITYEGILRGLANFDTSLAQLKVRDVMTGAPIFTTEDDLFDILDKLKVTNAVLITEMYGPDLVGIVTSYDSTEYFRNRTEDLMRVEDIEITIKELIKEAYLDGGGELDIARLEQAASKVSHRGQGEKPKSFDELTLGEYVVLLTHEESWHFFEKVFNMPRESVRELLRGIREIRNSLAHFRADISPVQRDKLKFGIEWLTRCQEEHQAAKRQEMIARMVSEASHNAKANVPIELSLDPVETSIASEGSTDFAVTESATGGGRYAPLADWLQSRPGGIAQVQLTFNKIEEIIGIDLPPSAREHRAWWANDSVGHSHSQLWLDAGWRTTYISLAEGRVSFNRIREREKAYIAFFSKLLAELRKSANFPVRDVSPDGVSWIVVQPVPRSGQSFGSFSYSFSRDKRLRVELYLDLLDNEQTKRVFDRLLAQKNQLEQEVGIIEWERLDNRRASRLALYQAGEISNNKNHVELRKWAVEAMIRFFNALVVPTEEAIAEAKAGHFDR